MKLTALGIDLAKSVFQLHGVDAQGKAVLRKRLSRAQLLTFVANLPACLIGMEACGGANFWAREFKKLGHEVRLISPQFVKPYVQSNKNDAADAEAICEALMRPRMRFVVPRSVEQQDIRGLHRVRRRRVVARTALCNEIRGLLSEYGVVLAQGRSEIRRNLSAAVEKGMKDGQISPQGQVLFLDLLAELEQLDQRIAADERKIESVHKATPECKRLAKIPGIGSISATAVIASVGDPNAFRNGREFSAWLGLVPKQYSSGGKERLLGISKRGDSYLRMLLIHGARAVIRYVDQEDAPQDRQRAWLKRLIERRGKNRAAVALANKNARRIWVLLARGEDYREAA